MLKYISILMLLFLVGCSTTPVEPSFGKTRETITQETMTGTVSLSKPGTKTIYGPEYCGITVNVTGMIPRQMYYLYSTPGVFGYTSPASSTGSWYFKGYILKSELPKLVMYRYVNYTTVALTPDYPLLQHPNIAVTNRCY